MRTVPAALVAAVLVLGTACGGGGSGAADDGLAPTSTSATAPAADAPPTSPPAGGGPSGLGDAGDVEQAFTGGDGPTVAVLGDSLTVQSRPALRAALADHALRIAAVRGEGFAGGPLSTAWETPLMRTAAADLGAADPDVAVVALGTNDAWTPDGTLPDALDALDAIVADLGETCLVAVLVDVDAPADDFDRDAAATINARLTDAADHVVDWGAVAAEPGVLSDDGIHPTPAGQERWAEAVAAGVEACTA